MSQEEAQREADSAITDFERQNPASKKLVTDVRNILDEALTGMVKEISELLEEASKK